MNGMLDSRVLGDPGIYPLIERQYDTIIVSPNTDRLLNTTKPKWVLKTFAFEHRDTGELWQTRWHAVPPNHRLEYYFQACRQSGHRPIALVTWKGSVVKGPRR